MTDIRDLLFQSIADRRFAAVLTAERSCVLSGAEDARAAAAALGVELELCREEGDEISHGERFGNLRAFPKQLALAEEQLIGTLSKASGIATAAKTAVQLADGRVKIVCGSWKKMPPSLKTMVRRAIATGGAAFRICEPPMLYLDKNYIRMLGSVSAALAASACAGETTRVIQIRGLCAPVREEVRQAMDGGADILMVDTGRTADLAACQEELARMGCRSRVKLAFAGNVSMADVPELAQWDIDTLCIGKEIVDARLADMKLDVVEGASI